MPFGLGTHKQETLEAPAVTVEQTAPVVGAELQTAMNETEADTSNFEQDFAKFLGSESGKKMLAEAIESVQNSHEASTEPTVDSNLDTSAEGTFQIPGEDMTTAQPAQFEAAVMPNASAVESPVNDTMDVEPITMPAAAAPLETETPVDENLQPPVAQ